MTHIPLSDHEHEDGDHHDTEADGDEQNPLHGRLTIPSPVPFPLRRRGIHMHITLSRKRVVPEALYFITARELNDTNTSQQHPPGFFSGYV